jgi:hypothetical protein
MADLPPVIETLEHRWMRAWVGRDVKTLKALTSRRFRLVVGSKPSVMLDQKSFLDAVPDGFECSSYRFGDIYVRDLGGLTIFATQLDLKATIGGEDFSGPTWVTDLWRKSKVRRKWTMVERVLSKPEEREGVAPAVRSLQLWHGRRVLPAAR